MQVFPTLYTNRLLLRKITIDDIPSLLKYGDNAKIAAYILNIPHPYREPDAVFRISYVHQGFKANTRYVFSIELREKEEFIGEISLHLDNERKKAELGYWIGEPFWKQGLVTEAIQRVLLFGFSQLNLQLVFASCKEENTGSIRVLEKNGFQKANTAGSVLQYFTTPEILREHKPL